MRGVGATGHLVPASRRGARDLTAARLVALWNLKRRGTLCPSIRGAAAMSIYRGARRRPDDIHATVVQAPDTREEATGEECFASLRRAQPAQSLLPRTSLWLSKFPERLRPSTLAAQFPRVANSLCANWSDPAARGRCLHDLLTGGTRTSRRGFPQAVVRELQRLYAVHTAVSGQGLSPWDDPLASDTRALPE